MNVCVYVGGVGGRSNLCTPAIKHLLRYRVCLTLHVNFPFSVLRHLHLKNLELGATKVKCQELTFL